MATIPLTNRFHTTTEQVPTTNLGSAQANSDRETYSMQDIVDTVGTVDYPSFTTDLDTEIQVAPVSIGGVLTPLYYKRFQTTVAAGSGSSFVTYAGISTIIKTNILIETLAFVGNYGTTNPGFSTAESLPQATCLYDSGKNIILTSVDPKVGAGGSTFVGAYLITYEVWYT